MKTIQFSLAAAGLVALLAGCASKGGAQNEPSTTRSAATADTTATPPHQHGMGMMGANMCPMAVPGTTASDSEVDGGAALTFTTTSGDVNDLRQRVRGMAEMHNAHHAGGGPGMGMGAGMRMPPATASAEDVDGGARLVFKATDPSQVDALRQNVKMRSERIARGDCPMMQMSGREEEPGGAQPPYGH